MGIRRCSGIVFAFGILVNGLQLSNFKSEKKLQQVVLNDAEVESRGSHCLNGQSPRFYMAEGSQKGKFLFWLHGGGYCTDEENCLDYINELQWEQETGAKPLQKLDAFSDYSLVYIKNCDLGVFTGDRDDPVTYNGHKMYFQGARILKHVVDTIANNYTMEQVLVAGGSGGGHSLFLIADYFQSLLPKTVTKYAVAPINGWYVSAKSDLADMYNLMKPNKVISSSCKSAFSSSEEYKCLDPETAYRYIKSSVFMTQIADYTLEWGVETEVKEAYTRCLTPESTTATCTSEDVEQVQGYLDNYTTLLQSYPRYTQNGEGGYLSTCTVHVFYNEDDMFSAYANNGVTVGDAISQWWMKLDSKPPAQWYLPCKLGDENHAQCESSCGDFYIKSTIAQITKEMETWRGL